MKEKIGNFYYSHSSMSSIPPCFDVTKQTSTSFSADMVSSHFTPKWINVETPENSFLEEHVNTTVDASSYLSNQIVCPQNQNFNCNEI